MSTLIIPKHDCIALSSDECSSFEHAAISSSYDLNFKDTELRLGLPGSGSPYWFSVDHDNNDDNGELEKHLVSGAKRVFSDAINGGFTKWGLDKNGGVDVKMKSSVLVDEKKKQSSSPSKEQVVGWPPVRSFRKNSMAVINQKTNEDKENNSESECLYIKVSMDGAPYLRKVDLKTYNSYVELSLALEKMFSGFTTGYHGQLGTSGEDKLSKGRFAESLHRSEYVLTYEDKDGDWMLVGDVPWNMFMDTCRRLRIMKSSEAVGLASTRGTTEE